MGGFGSGRYSSMPTVEMGLTLDLNRLIRQRNVRPGEHISGTLTWTMTRSGKKVGELGYEARLTYDGARWVRLHYLVNSVPMDYTVYLRSTPCNFGGVRWWWVCPLTGATVAKLYLPPGAKTFAARDAYRLPYRSQRETRIDRTHARKAKVIKTLGGNYDNYDGYFPERPKGMHKKTYNRLAGELEKAIEAHDTAFTIGAWRIIRKFDLFHKLTPR